MSFVEFLYNSCYFWWKFTMASLANLYPFNVMGVRVVYRFIFQVDSIIFFRWYCKDAAVPVPCTTRADCSPNVSAHHQFQQNMQRLYIHPRHPRLSHALPPFCWAKHDFRGSRGRMLTFSYRTGCRCRDWYTKCINLLARGTLSTCRQLQTPTDTFRQARRYLMTYIKAVQDSWFLEWTG